MIFKIVLVFLICEVIAANAFLNLENQQLLKTIIKTFKLKEVLIAIPD